jgi:hypothetical protein
MFSKKIQYNAPLPGEEWRRRDVSVPAEAAKVVHEIDSLHGDNREVCLTIFQQVFRGSETVSKIVNERAKNIAEGEEGGEWRFHATVTRNIKVAKFERLLESNKNKLQILEAELLALEAKSQKFALSFPGSPAFQLFATPATPARNIYFFFFFF